MDGLNIEYFPVPSDGDCLYVSLLALARQYILPIVMPGADTDAFGQTLDTWLRTEPRPAQPPAVERAVQALRNWVADRLAADFAVANQGLPPRYVLHYEAGPDANQQQQRWLAEIRQPMSWNNNIGESTIQVLARELGIPTMVVQARGDPLRLGPRDTEDDVDRLVIVRTPMHYQGGRYTDGRAVQFGLLTPAPQSTALAAPAPWDPHILHTRARVPPAQ